MDEESSKKPFSLNKISNNKIFVIIIILYALYIIVSAFADMRSTQKRKNFCNEAAAVIMDMPDYVYLVEPFAFPKLTKGESVDINIKEDMVFVLMRFTNDDWEQFTITLPDEYANQINDIALKHNYNFKK